jgi:hypothetical protein
LTPAALCVAKRHLAEVTALGYNEAAKRKFCLQSSRLKDRLMQHPGFNGFGRIIKAVKTAERFRFILHLAEAWC